MPVFGERCVRGGPVSNTKMTCRQIVGLITEYFEGVLSPSDLGRFEAHLKTCPHCISYVEQMSQTVKALGCLPGGTMPEALMQDLLRAFRGWKQDPRTVEFFQLGTPGHEVPPGSHMVHYYATDQERDDFSLRYLTAGLQAGENCVILGDPGFADYAAHLLQSSEPAAGWPGRLFTAPWDRSPSSAAVVEFVELHGQINERGPSGLLPEVPLRRNGPAPSTRRVRGLGNFRHWSRTELGSRCTLQLCASVEEAYRGGTGIVVCQWETPRRSAAFRWGALAVHRFMVNGTCIARPCEALERYVQGGAAGLEELLAVLHATPMRDGAADVTRTVREDRSALAEIRHFFGVPRRKRGPGGPR
jgi:putative zinc finger protein